MTGSTNAGANFKLDPASEWYNPAKFGGVLDKPGLFFYSVTGASAVPWNATSILCVKSPIQRTQSQSSGGTSAACDGRLTLDWNQFQSSHPVAIGKPWSAGDVVHVQAWFRDPPAGKSTNLSNGIELTYVP